MNWVKEFNNKSKEHENMIYKLCSERYELFEKSLNEYTHRFQSLIVDTKYKMKKFDSFEEMTNYIEHEVDSITTSYTEYSKSFKALVSKDKKHLSKILFDDTRNIGHLANECHQLRYFINRTYCTRKSFFDKYNFFLLDLLSNFEDTVRECITELKDFLDEQRLKNSTVPKVIKKDKKTEYEKIFDYKEMQKYAVRYGYVYKWSNGDHNIYEHEKSHKIVVIPAHELGKGLSIAIQKQVKSNQI